LNKRSAERITHHNVKKILDKKIAHYDKLSAIHKQAFELLGDIQQCDILISGFEKMTTEMTFPVDEINVIGNYIIVKWDKMYFIGPDNIRRFIGDITVVVSLEDGSVEVSSTELHTRDGKLMPHPHMNSGEGGYPCWGNVETDIGMYIKNGQYKELFMLIKSFLSSVNIEDAWGTSYENWPPLEEDNTSDDKESEDTDEHNTPGTESDNTNKESINE